MTNKIKTTQERIQYLDLAKGVLIAMLIFHHIVDVGVRINHIDNNVLLFMKMIQDPLIVCYFMPAFFFITGMCSNFNKDFNSFITNQIKTLLLPAIVFVLAFHIYQGDPIKTLAGDVKRLFLLGTDYWFITALFEAKVMFYFLHKYIRKKIVLIIVLLSLSLFGVLLNDFLAEIYPNDFFMIRHSLDLLFFIGIGNLLKEYHCNKRVVYWSSILFFVIVSLFIITGNKLPYVTYSFTTNYITWPIHLVISFSGTIIVINICRKLPINSLIEYIGKNSLSIYLIQWYTLIMFMEVFSNVFNENELKSSIICAACIFISTIALGLFVAYITNNSKLRVLMGKF